MFSERLKEWAHQVRTGTTTVDPGPVTERDDIVDFTTATYRVASYRTRQAQIAYIKARNGVRWKRLQQDYQWARRMMEEMGSNPDDAKFLL